MFRKFAKLDVLEVKSAASQQRTASLAKFADYNDYRTDDGYVYVRVRAISSRVNKNHDGWPSEELNKAYRSFIGKPIFVDHHNSDPKRARGFIVDAALHVEDLEKTSAFDPYYASAPDNHKPPTWIELLLEVDAKKFPKLAKAIVNSNIDGVSMGANVERTKCSHCGNWATTPEQYCQHVRSKGAYFDHVDSDGQKTSKKSYEDCYDIGFFEISFVFDPADETALVNDIRTAAKISEIQDEGENFASAPGQMDQNSSDYAHLIHQAQAAFDSAFTHLGGGDSGPSQGFLAAKRAVEQAGYPQLAFSIANEVKQRHLGLVDQASQSVNDDGEHPNPLDFQDSFVDMPSGIDRGTQNNAVWSNLKEALAPATPGMVHGADRCAGCGEMLDANHSCTNPQCMYYGRPGASDMTNAQQAPVAPGAGSGLLPAQAKTADRRNPEPQSDMTVAPDRVDTLRQDQLCPICGSDMADGVCEVCNYEEPPEGFDNPDLEKAQEVDQQMRQQDAEQAAAGMGNDAPNSVDPNQAQPVPQQPGGAPPQQMAASATVISEKTSANNGRVNTQERPILPVTRKPSDQPSDAKTIQDATRPKESSARKDTMSDNIRTADGATPNGGADVQAERRVDVEGVGSVAGDPEAGTSHENVEKAMGQEGGPHTDTWSKGEGDSLGQHEPVTSDGFVGGGPIGEALASTHTADSTGDLGGPIGEAVGDGKAQKGGPTWDTSDAGFPDHQPSRVDLQAPLKEEVGQGTRTDSNEEYRSLKHTEPVTTENANEIGGPIGEAIKAPLSSYQHVVVATQLVDMEIDLGITEKDDKYNRLAALEKTDPVEIQAELRAHQRAASVRTKTASTKTAGAHRMPSLAKKASTDFVVDIAPNWNPEDSLF